MTARLLLALVLLVATSARADDAALPSQEQASLQSYAAAHPECAEWTDGCVVCAGGANCSNIGIACQPGPYVCKTPKP